MTNDIRFSKHHHLGMITLTRPQALNALNLTMINALQQQLSSWQADDSVHAVVIQAEGRAFCAGGDIRELHTHKAHDLSEKLHFFWHEYRLNYFIRQFSKPYIALMDGITMGGGVGIALHGSHPIAGEHFSFAMPETGIGFFPDVGASYLLAHCPGYLGFYLGLTGNRLNVDESFAAGLIKGIIPAEHFADFLTALSETDLSLNAFVGVERCLSQYSRLPQSSTELSKNNSMINDCFSHASVGDILSALSSKKNEWARKVHEQLLKKSPLSLEVTFIQLHRAKSMKFAACLKMDYLLASHFLKDSDFYEGIRALLVDKDNQPQWQPSSLTAIDEHQVANYFIQDTTELVFIN